MEDIHSHHCTIPTSQISSYMVKKKLMIKTEFNSQQDVFMYHSGQKSVTLYETCIVQIK